MFLAVTLKIDRDFVVLALIVVTLVLGYFLSFQIQKIFARWYRTFEKKIGVFTTKREYAIQRYVYQHRNSPIARLYTWVNNQIISLGLKNLGITPMGYLMFWAFVAVVLTVIISMLSGLGLFMTGFFWLVIYVCLLVMTRVIVSEKMERRENDVMDAIDLIIPEIGNGVKNSILRYQDNFPVSLRSEFKAFVSNIQDRGYTFNDAMYILADQLGLIFYDFAQKAIFYEAIGEADMVDIFSDITETNRIRRELRDKNTVVFNNLKVSFIASSFITFGYFLFLMATDSFSRSFFLHETVGKFLLLVIMIVVFGVLSFITTIKSRAI